MRSDHARTETDGRLRPKPVPESSLRGGGPGPRPAIEIYGWQVRGKPVSVKIAIDLINRLQNDISHGLNMHARCDVSGLLIGRIVVETGPIFVVEDYELAGYSHESVTPLLARDELLADMVQVWSKRDGPRRVVGFFRSQRNGWPAIDLEDSKAAKRLLHRSHNIFLVIRSAVNDDHKALLFLRQGRSATVEEAYGEFPFNADLLRAGSQTPPTADAAPVEPAVESPLMEPPLPGASAELTFPGAMATVLPEQPQADTKPPMAVVPPALPREIPAKPKPRQSESEAIGAGQAKLATETAPKLSVPAEPAKQSFWTRLLRRVIKERPLDQPSGPPLVVEASEQLPEVNIAQRALGEQAHETPVQSAAQQAPRVERTESLIEETVAWKSPATKWKVARNKPIQLSAYPTPSPDGPSSSFYPREKNKPAEAENASQDESPVRFSANSTPPHSWRSWLSVAATWAIAVGVTMWLMDGRNLFTHHEAKIETATSKSIGLRVDGNAGLLDIVWDRASDLARESQGGFLTIRDGKQVKSIPLDSVEIRTGHVYYEPRSTDLGIRLEVAQKNGVAASESIRVVGPPSG